MKAHLRPSGKAAHWQPGGFKLLEAQTSFEAAKRALELEGSHNSARALSLRRLPGLCQKRQFKRRAAVVSVIASRKSQPWIPPLRKRGMY
jgi:hypothetical protein